MSIPNVKCNELTCINAASLQAKAKDAALKGLDFLVRNQIRNSSSADNGRFPFVYDCENLKALTLSTNWTTGVAVSALLAGYKFTRNKKYLETAAAGCSYIKSLQDFNPNTPRTNGVFHEVTPQSEMAHPRDALTAAWALLDYSIMTGDEDGINRARRYGDWFTSVGLEKGYPYWTVRFDNKDWEPFWCGSFHSGSAFFMYRLYQETGVEKFLKAMCDIANFYNQYHLDKNGRITVILDRDTLESLDGKKTDTPFTIRGWEIMHQYNDDLGALANLAAWKLTGNRNYSQGAERFFLQMHRSQHENGGFGPEEWSIPSAGGAVLLEMLAAKQIGIISSEYDEVMEKAVGYLLNLQNNAPESSSGGAFFGMNDDYAVSTTLANTRTTAYAIMGLMRYAGAVDNIYFFE